MITAPLQLSKKKYRTYKERYYHSLFLTYLPMCTFLVRLLLPITIGTVIPTSNNNDKNHCQDDQKEDNGDEDGHNRQQPHGIVGGQFRCGCGQLFFCGL